MPPENVRCIYFEGSGCYGRNGHEDAAADAALLAKPTGKPVRVQWSRADEHGWDPKGPPTLIDLRAALDASGNVTAWESEFFIPQQTAGGFQVPFVAATLTGMPARRRTSRPATSSRTRTSRTSSPTSRTVCHRLETTPFRPSWIRTPGRMQNTYANECFMDELAAAAGADPIEFRLKYLDPNDKRGHRGAEPRRHAGEVGQAALAAQGRQSGDVVDRARRHLLQVRARCAPTWPRSPRSR